MRAGRPAGGREPTAVVGALGPGSGGGQSLSGPALGGVAAPWKADPDLTRRGALN